MKFPFWLFPIILITALIPLINKEQQSWDKMSTGDRQKRLALLAGGVLGLVILVFVLFILK
jgi:hypothetical protein